VAALLAAHLVLHMRIGLERDQHAAGLRLMLEPRRKIQVPPTIV
jgi:hypothetical protein